jgi:Asp-tRNA(Asn)/Glu-tRNA(Gln) amidotransferase A subunit family amidase
MSGTSKLNHLSLVEAAQAIQRGDVTSEALVRDCLARIEERDGIVKAWASYDPDHVLAQARACDAGSRQGPLHGVPVGIKDVLNTFDYPTQMGSPIYAGYRSRNDAACVAMLRSAGALILGKTHTCEFAGIHPNVTTNPLAQERTPGGSSSGSAAAVADHMVPLAIGTQTGGSVLRPASFCGVVGFKPTFGTFNREGLKFAAESIDTIGLITRSVADAAFATSLLTGGGSYVHAPLSAPPRLAVCRTHMWEQAEASSRACVEQAIAKARAAGAEVTEIILPQIFADLTAAREIINDVERARSLPWEWTHKRDMLSPIMCRTIEKGLLVADVDYRRALNLAALARLEIAQIIKGFDAVLAPCVNGEAPVGLHYTGDPSFQALWSLLYLPSISIPAHSGPASMPVGLQLIAAAGDDKKLLGAALWMQQVASVGMDLKA